MNEKKAKRKRIFKILFTTFTCLWLCLIEIIVPRVMPMIRTVYDKFDLSQSHFIQMAQRHVAIPHGVYLLVTGLIVILLIMIHRSSRKLWPSVTANSIAIFISISYLVISTVIISLPLMEHSVKIIGKHISAESKTPDRQSSGR